MRSNPKTRRMSSGTPPLGWLADRFGDVPIEGDERVIEQMVRTLGLNWTESILNRSGRGRLCGRSVEASASWPTPCCSAGA